MPGIAVSRQPLAVAGEAHARRDRGTWLIPAQACQHHLKLIFIIWGKKNGIIGYFWLRTPKRAANPPRAYGRDKLLHVHVAVTGAG
jgi:hypothetical protein